MVKDTRRVCVTLVNYTLWNVYGSDILIPIIWQLFSGVVGSLVKILIIFAIGGSDCSEGNVRRQ